MGKPSRYGSRGFLGDLSWKQIPSLSEHLPPCIMFHPLRACWLLDYNVLAFLSEKQLDQNARKKAQNSTSLSCFPDRLGPQIEGGPQWLVVKSPSIMQELREAWHGFDPCIWKIPWRRAWQPTPVFLPGESHGQRSLVGYSPWSRKRLGHYWATKTANIRWGLRGAPLKAVFLTFGIFVHHPGILLRCRFRFSSSNKHPDEGSPYCWFQDHAQRKTLMFCLSLTLLQSWSYVTYKNLLAIFMQLELYGQVLTKHAPLSRHFNVVKTHARFLSVLLCINRVFRYTHFPKRCLWTRICPHRSHKDSYGEVGSFFSRSFLSFGLFAFAIPWMGKSLNTSENYLSLSVFASCLYKKSCSMYLEHIGSTLRKCIIW